MTVIFPSGWIFSLTSAIGNCIPLLVLCVQVNYTKKAKLEMKESSPSTKEKSTNEKPAPLLMPLARLSEAKTRISRENSIQ